VTRHLHTCPECGRKWECSACEFAAGVYAVCFGCREVGLDLSDWARRWWRALGVAA